MILQKTKEFFSKNIFLSRETMFKIKFFKNLININHFIQSMLLLKKKNIIKSSFWFFFYLEKNLTVMLFTPKWFTCNYIKRKLLKEKKKKKIQYIHYNYIELIFAFYTQTKKASVHLNKLFFKSKYLYRIRLKKIWKNIKKAKANLNIMRLCKMCSSEILSIKITLIEMFQIFLNFYY
mmetsp:Transcript_5577/g.17787  ORF Transcript_5577/g.17787 Transcript_5577/m.17787 type:complete len:178 (+) Transcript_5577:3799-4332(+)